MFQGSQKILKGHKWVTSGGANACERCAALDGQEFYYDPKPGQKSTADMPEPPLHPNCRCKTIEIMDYVAYVEENAESAAAKEDEEERKKNPYLYKGKKFKLLGGQWGNDGRAIFDGPAYEYYGGQNWSAGRNPKNVKPEEQVTEEKRPTPADDMDTHFRDHDDGYDRCEKSPSPRDCRLECDKKLIRDLESLPEDPVSWRRPPNLRK